MRSASSVSLAEESVCMMRNGINDFLDYTTIVVVIVIPTIIGTSDKIPSSFINFSSTIIRNGTLHSSHFDFDIGVCHWRIAERLDIIHFNSVLFPFNFLFSSSRT